jgi:lactoylglutathione lyase
MRHFWGDLLGTRKVGDFTSESENVVEDIIEVGKGAATVEIDLMQPLDADSKPRVDSPPLNHIGLWIDDLPAAVRWLGDNGVRFTPGGIRAGASGHDICFIHPKGNDESPYGGQGVLIELVQATPEVIEQLG